MQQNPNEEIPAFIVRNLKILNQTRNPYVRFNPVHPSTFLKSSGSPLVSLASPNSPNSEVDESDFGEDDRYKNITMHRKGRHGRKAASYTSSDPPTKRGEQFALRFDLTIS